MDDLKNKNGSIGMLRRWTMKSDNHAGSPDLNGGKEKDLGSDDLVVDESMGSLKGEKDVGTNIDDVPVEVAYPPAPDGGWRAWSQAICAHLVVFNCWGYIQSFGVFQSYFTEVLPESPSVISWIGSLQIFLLFFLGIVSGRALDAGIFRPMFFLGLALQMVGMFCTSITPSHFWRIILTQGLTQGIGNGLQFPPTMSLLSTYFQKNRAVALAIAATGSSMGGLVYPVIVRALLPKIGFAWTVRVCAFVMLTVGLVAGCGLRTRPGLPPRKAGPLFELGAFKELPYTLFLIGNYLVFFGLFFAFYYISSFARDIIHQPQSISFSLLILLNGTGMALRILPAYFADRYTGPLNLMIPLVFVTSIIAYSWLSVHDLPGTWAWTTMYGLIAAGAQGLFPAVLSSLTDDPTKQGVRMGMGFAFVGIASATGPPVGGALIERMGGSYVGAQIWAASCIAAGGAVLLAARWAKVGWTVRRV